MINSVTLINENNMNYRGERDFSLVYADCIYESKDFSWVEKFWEMLGHRGIFIIQTDWHTSHLYRCLMEEIPDSTFVNHLVWKNEWGNHPKNRFHQCYDDILIYAKGESWKFYPERIQVDKVTKTKGLNPSGRETKTATAWIGDITLTTTAKERVKKKDGHLLRWQKPLGLYDRIISPFTDEGDSVLDPFMGSGSLGKWCKANRRRYVGIEMDGDVFDLARYNIDSDNYTK